MNRPRIRRLALVALGAAALLAYAALLYRHVVFGVGGTDSSGYVNEARLIARGHVVERIAALDELGLPDADRDAFVPLGFAPRAVPRTMAPFYPPGFPAHVAVASTIFGRDVGPFVVSPLAAAACVLLMFLLARELGLPLALAAAGAGAFGGFSVVLFQGVQPMSDVVASLWVMAAMLAALRARRRAAESDAAARIPALATGLALGVAVLVRPTNALVVPAVALALPWRPRVLAWCVAGGAPLALVFLLWNRVAFGGALQTGYAEQLGPELALSNFPVRALHYARWLRTQLSPLVVAGWLALPLAARIARRDRAMLLAWFAPSFLFFCLWGPYETWWYTRYLLPVAPALILATLRVAHDHLAAWAAAAGAPRWRRWLATGGLVATCAIIGSFELASVRSLRPLHSLGAQRTFPDVSRALAALAGGKKALVLSVEVSGAVRFYASASDAKLVPVRSDRLSPAAFARLRTQATAHGYQILAALMPWERVQAATNAPGSWKVAGQVRDAVLWRLDPTDAPAPGSAVCAPRPELCNGRDDDCNGRVDDLSRVAYSDEGIAPALVKQKDPRCTLTIDDGWLACNGAIHRYCTESGCGTTGFGSLEWGATGTVTVACLETEPPREVDASELSAFGECHPEVAPLAARRFECGQAIHRYCRSHGYASGFGPVAGVVSPFASGSPEAPFFRFSVVCLRADGAEVVPTTFSALGDFHDGCGDRAAPRRSPTYCLTAAKRLCVDRGSIVGFGPVSDDGHGGAEVVCLR